MIQERAVTIRLSPRVYEPLDRQLKAIAPQRRLGFPKALIVESFCQALVIGLQRPDAYSLQEMLRRMYEAAIPSGDEEGQEMIDSLFK